MELLVVVLLGAIVAMLGLAFLLMLLAKGARRAQAWAQWQQLKEFAKASATADLAKENERHAKQRDVLLASGNAEGLAAEHDRHQLAVREIAEGLNQILTAKSMEELERTVGRSAA